MNELADVVMHALGLAVTVVVPLALAALAGGVVGGLAATLVGLQDQTVALLFRAASVVVALVLAGGLMAQRVQDYTRESWTGLAALGSLDPEP